MIQFYKKRDFGGLIADTFNFVKLYGKNYFKNYFLINGLLLILIILLMMLGLKDFFAFFLNGDTPDSSYVEAYLQENTTLLAVIMAIMAILFILAIIINYAYPVLYIKRLAETQNKNIKVDDILADTKRNAKKLFSFALGFMFIVAPLATIIIGISYLLIFIIIGIVVLLIVTPVVMNMMNFLLFDYLNTNRGFFSSLSYSIRSQFSYQNHTDGSPFWKYWGTTIVFYIILQVITSVFTIIPFFVLGIQSGLSETGGSSFEKSIPIVFVIAYALSMLVSFILSNLLYICTALMYYDSRTDLHRKLDLSEIDNIGKNEI